MARQKKEQRLDTSSIKVDWKKDYCLLCGKETIYDFTTPISQRVFYMEGAGQLCRECYIGLNIDK